MSKSIIKIFNFIFFSFNCFIIQGRLLCFIIKGRGLRDGTGRPTTALVPVRPWAFIDADSRNHW